MSVPARPTGVLRLLIVLVGLHSVGLGVVLLVAPVAFVEVLGFARPPSAFFPSQSGVFLVALGVCYLLALRHAALVLAILVSKSLAVAFLVVHASFLDAPPLVAVAAAGDAAMLLAVAAAWRHASR